MGQATPKNIEQRVAILNDWKVDHSRGWTTRLAEKYSLTRARVGQIVGEERLLDAMPRPDDQI
jgi:hypothetical protein